uniref:DUF4515 domain-containing protein n=1 Tax=Apteryx owenii TaxID=8824 RepID=A0A8B9NTU7_APTOW
MTSKKKKLKQDTIRTGTNKEGLGTKNGEISKGRSPMETLVRERKQYLQEEYKTLTEHMNTYMGRVERFLHENDILEKEAQQNQEESNAYLSYITKYSQKCQNVIITLNDQNHTDLSQIWKQKEKLISQYTEKEKEVRNYLMDMEKKYSLMNKEVEDLQPFKDLAAGAVAGGGLCRAGGFCRRCPAARSLGPFLPPSPGPGAGAGL